MPAPEAKPTFHPTSCPTVQEVRPFREVRRLAEVDSTNRYLLDEARRGTPAGLVVVAARQHAGRGRLGRTWESPPGGSLLTSVLLRPALPIDRRHLVVLAAAVAMADAIADTTGIDAAIKWPNDLLVGDRKVAGILAESTGDAVVVGIGVNVAWGQIPEELGGIATALDLEGGRPVAPDALLDAFLARYGPYLGDLDRARDAYRARLSTRGRRVRVEQAAGLLTGVAVDVDDDGHLLLDDDEGRRVTVAAGDVVHLRPA